MAPQGLGPTLADRNPGVGRTASLSSEDDGLADKIQFREAAARGLVSPLAGAAAWAPAPPEPAGVGQVRTLGLSPTPLSLSLRAPLPPKLSDWLFLLLLLLRAHVRAWARPENPGQSRTLKPVDS